MAAVSIRAVHKRFGSTPVIRSVDIEIVDGEFCVLVGPSGCGKSTLLRMLAGLEEITGGEIWIGSRIVNRVAPKERDIAMVFQNYALYPHMTVRDNMSFALMLAKQSKSEIGARVARAADILGLAQLLDRYPRQLSGGQRQRVAMGRAIVRDPQVFLFDEPLSNLDAKLRAEMRVELRELQRRLDITSVYVTHDQEEALAISDRVIVMHVGGIEQIGTPEDIYHRPKTRFVADFVGSANLITGRLSGPIAGPVYGRGGIRFESDSGITLHAWAEHPPRGDEDTVAVRTAHIALSANGAPSASGPSANGNSATGRIRQRLFHGDFIQYIIDWPGGTLTVRRPPTESYDEGATVTLSFAPENCVLLEG